MSQNPNHHHYSVNNLQIELQDIGSAVATPKSSATERKLRNEIWKNKFISVNSAKKRTEFTLNKLLKYT